MPLSVRIAGAVQPVNAMRLLTGGALRPVKTLRMMHGGALVTIAAYQSGPVGGGNLTATPSADYVSGYSSSYKPQRVRSDTVIVTPNGGLAPYSYAWSTSGGEITPISPSMATTAFEAILFNQSVSDLATCIVTDASGATASVTVSVSLSQGSVDGPLS